MNRRKISMIAYRSGFKYQLEKTYSIWTSVFPAEAVKSNFLNLHKNGCLTISKGYAWDGASGPTFDTKTFIRASLVHDAFCQLIKRGLLPAKFRLTADQELWRICKDAGMFRFRAWYVYNAVRKGGGLFNRFSPHKLRFAP